MALTDTQSLRVVKIQIAVLNNNAIALQTALDAFVTDFSGLITADQENTIKKIDKTFIAKYKFTEDVVTALTVAIDTTLSMTYDYGSFINNLLGYERQTIASNSTEVLVLDAQYVICMMDVPYELKKNNISAFLNTVLENEKAFASHGAVVENVIAIVEANVAV